MLQRLLFAAVFVLASADLSVSLSANAAPAAAADAPTLYAIKGAPRSLAGGAQRIWSVQVSEDRAMDAVFKGGMWLPNGAGGRVYARYVRHILHPDGTWTWI